MKKGFKFYAVIWVALLALFNVIAFVSVGWEGFDKYTPSFWIGYVFVTLSLIIQLACVYFALSKNNSSEVFYNIPVLRLSYDCLVAMIIVGSLCMIISPLRGFVTAILCGIILVINIIPIIKAGAAAELISKKDKEIKEKTFFMKFLAADAESLLTRATNPEAKEACKKAYEAVRYADPMSDDALAEVENRISAKFSELSTAVNENDLEKIKTASNEFSALIFERNAKCKFLK